MANNISMGERIVRVIIGLAMVASAVVFPSSPYSVFGWFGLIFLATGLLGWCAIYRIFGISTADPK
ncbi:DUF2892 domain-containing protein [Pseudahrensia aquimaris]|uniref:DUF2892 domain-containing protein n=1 Tax=Pseudahrensia aquimaris TaxID=744461 RepID=A0ABW3FBI5_9HYPH